ncbi:MAG: hypothetical protein U0931_18135 [Vulcanimicrobiota bacterium]
MRRFVFLLTLLCGVWAPVAAQQVTGTVSEWYGGAPGVSPKTRGLTGVTVVIGPNLDLKIGQGGLDEVLGAVTTRGGTGETGAYQLNVPPGRYTIIFWKQGYTPQVDTVTSPGTWDASISVDKSMQGLHQQLR